LPRPAAADEDSLAVGDDGGHALNRRTFDFPELLSRLGIEAGNKLAAGDDELVFAGDVEHSGGSVVVLFWPRLAPDLLAILLIECRDDAANVTVSGDQNQVTVDHWRGRKALMHCVIGHFRLPKLVAG